MTNILFRADSSSVIGHGHIMRDLTLAKQIRERLPDTKFYFATKNLTGNINNKILQENFILININQDTKKEFKNIIDKYNIDFIILDNYEIELEIESYLSNICDILVFDDEFKRHCAKWVLNHSFIAKKENYDYLLNTHILAGAQYTLLDDAFLSAQSTYVPLKTLKKKRVLITLGGSDPLHLSFTIKKYLLKNYKDIKVSIVTTSANPKLNYLKRVDKTLIINEQNMSKLMQLHDLIITSASSSLLETFALNKAFITIKCAKNQTKTVDILKRQNLSNIIENFNLSTLKKALNCVQYQRLKIKKVVNKYNFKKDGIIEELLNEQ